MRWRSVVAVSSWYVLHLYPMSSQALQTDNFWTCADSGREWCLAGGCANFLSWLPSTALAPGRACARVRDPASHNQAPSFILIPASHCRKQPRRRLRRQARCDSRTLHCLRCRRPSSRFLSQQCHLPRHIPVSNMTNSSSSHYQKSLHVHRDGALYLPM